MATNTLSEVTDANSSDDDSDTDNSKLDNGAPDTWMRNQFREYCAKQQRTYGLTETEITAVRLLYLLKEKRAPLNAYKSLMHWHLSQRKEVLPGQRLHDNVGYIGRKKLLKDLAKRYNYNQQFPHQKVIKLPVSGTVVLAP